MRFKKILFCLLFILFMPVVRAGSFSISSSSSSVSVGNSVTVYVSASEAAGRFSVSSSDSSVLAFNDNASSVWLDNSSSSFKFIAKSAGKATLTVTPSDCAGYDEKEITGSKSIIITVNPSSGGSSSNNSGSSSSNKKTVVSDTPKSSINYLSSLGVEGFSLSPSFDKEVTEYDVTLPNGTTSINVIGEKESSVSYVTGLGSVDVSEGINNISVVVSAENGAKRTYSIRATVEEESPFVVSVDGSDFTLIRKAESMPSASDYYTLSSVVIDEIDVPCYVSDITGYKLVALKDSLGNISLYRYDDGKYVSYSEYGFNYLKLSLIDPDDVPLGYTLGSVTIDEKEVKAYIKDGSLSLLYGVNLETGESNFYSYDSLEGTIQKFILGDVSNSGKFYPCIIFGLVGVSLLEFIIIICVIVSKNRKLKKILRNKMDDKVVSSVSNKDLDDTLGRTAVISNSVGNVFDGFNDKKIKKSKKNDDDDMFKF